MAHLHCCCLSAVLLLLSPFALAGYTPDLLARLPGQSGNVSFHQYAGYITINATAGRAFYYYFAEAETAPEDRPLTLWLNGGPFPGPGCSSVGLGAFTEIGPFAPSGQKLIPNAYSWNKISNVLFVESPAGVGFSYSNTSSDYETRANDLTTAEDNLHFLLNWLGKFPEYKGRSLYLTGEGYAGHYVPRLALNVVDYMTEFGTAVLNLRGIAIGNPLLHNGVDGSAIVTFLRTHGQISDHVADVILENCNSKGRLSTCLKGWGYAYKEMGYNVDTSDVIADACVSSSAMQQQMTMMQNKVISSQISLGMDVCIRDEATVYLNREDVQHALHANVTDLPYPWTVCSSVLHYDGPSTNLNMLPVLEQLLNNGVPIFAYSGDQAAIVPFLGTRSLINRLAKHLKLNATVPYSSWYQGQQVGGWTVSYGKLRFATVRGAGVRVPASQPTRALQLFYSIITGLPLPASPNAKEDPFS